MVVGYVKGLDHFRNVRVNLDQSVLTTKYCKQVHTEVIATGSARRQIARIVSCCFGSRGAFWPLPRPSCLTILTVSTLENLSCNECERQYLLHGNRFTAVNDFGNVAVEITVYQDALQGR